MTIGDFLIKNIRNGSLSIAQPQFITGMGETWMLVPDRKFQPGTLKNVHTGSILSTVSLFEYKVDNSWYF